MQQIKKSSYRQRVYQANDTAAVTITLVFGDDAAPLNADGTVQNLLADHDIVESVLVTDHLS